MASSNLSSVVNASNRSHRTVVFIRVKNTLKADEVERFEKLVQAFNRPPQAADGGTIKVDIFTVHGNQVAKGFVKSIGGSTTTVAAPELSASVKAALAASGYTATPPAPKVVKTPAPSGRIDSPSLRKAAKAAGYTLVSITSTGD